MVADVSNLASMAAKLGAIYISQEEDSDLAPAQYPASQCSTQISTSRGHTRSVVTQGLSPPLVNARTTPGLLRKTKVAPIWKSHSLPAKVVH